MKEQVSKYATYVTSFACVTAVAVQVLVMWFLYSKFFCLVCVPSWQLRTTNADKYKVRNNALDDASPPPDREDLNRKQKKCRVTERPLLGEKFPVVFKICVFPAFNESALEEVGYNNSILYFDGRSKYNRWAQSQSPEPSSWIWLFGHQLLGRMGRIHRIWGNFWSSEWSVCKGDKHLSSISFVVSW